MIVGTDLTHCFCLGNFKKKQLSPAFPGFKIIGRQGAIDPASPLFPAPLSTMQNVVINILTSGF